MIVAVDFAGGLRVRGSEEILLRAGDAPVERCYMSFTPRELLSALPAPKPVQLCSWCRNGLIRHGAIARPSHGCCARCAEQLLAEPDSAEAAP